LSLGLSLRLGFLSSSCLPSLSPKDNAGRMVNPVKETASMSPKTIPCTWQILKEMHGINLCLRRVPDLRFREVRLHKKLEPEIILRIGTRLSFVFLGTQATCNSRNLPSFSSMPEFLSLFLEWYADGFVKELFCHPHVGPLKISSCDSFNRGMLLEL